MSNFPMDFSNFELEITNRCNLACPGCSRTDFIERFPKAWRNHDLDLDDFKKFIEPIIDEIEVFEFKGTMGDPIFHPRFLRWIEWCKSLGKRVSIHTNGQAGDGLWKKLATVVDSNDKITLGIDGLSKDFTKYRINANWKNIESCAKIMSGRVKLVWQFIIFIYNEHEIEEARQLSKTMGFDEFVAIESKHWDSDAAWVRSSNDTSADVFDPQCMQSPTHIVTADGHYMPCCHLIDHRVRYKTPWSKEFNIKEFGINDVIKSSISGDFFAKLDDMNAPDYCRTICGRCDGK